MVAAVASGALVWWATGPWGPGLSPDAIAYSAIAEGIRDLGELGYWLEPSVSSWPPLFPAVLAAISAVADISVVDAGRVVNALCQGLTVVAAALLGWRLLSNRWLFAVAVATAAVAQPLVYVSIKVWSEPLCNVCVLFAAFVLSGMRGRREVPRLLVASGLVACAFLTRYAGLAFVAGGVLALLVWPRSASWSTRIRRVVWFAAPAAMVAVATVSWNRWRTGNTFGPRWRPDEPFWNHAIDALRSVGQWFLPADSAGGVATVFGMAVLLAVVLAMLRPGRHEPSDGVEARRTGVVVVLTCFVATYLAYMVWARTVSGFDPLNGRLMVPTFVPLVLLVLSLVDRLAAAQTSMAVRVAVLALPVVLLGPTIRNGLDELRTSHDLGNEYTNAAVQAFVASTAVQEIPADCRLLSNDPWLLWLTGREAQLTPEENREVAIPQSMELSELGGYVAERPTCLVWLATGSTVFHTPDELRAEVDLTELTTDGFTTIYRLSPRA